MRKKIVLLCSTLILSLFAFLALAQEEYPEAEQEVQMNIERFQARMREYVKAAAGLTQEEADKYFPLSHELQRKLLELNRNHREKVEYMQKNQAGMTDEELFRQLLEKDVEVRQQQAALDILYNKKFLEILSSEKLYNARQAERTFMMRELVNFREQEQQEEK